MQNPLPNYYSYYFIVGVEEKYTLASPVRLEGRTPKIHAEVRFAPGKVYPEQVGFVLGTAGFSYHDLFY